MGISSFFAKYDSADASENADAAVRDVKNQMAGLKPAQVLYFAAKNYAPDRLAAAMRDAFPGAVTFGCASSGEIVNANMMTGALAVMAFEQDAFEFFDIAVLRRLGPDGKPADPAKQVEEAFAQFEAKLGRSIASLESEYDKYVGLTFADGLPYYLEPILDRVGDLTSVPFIGGIAGDDGAFAFTPVFYDGKSYTDAVVLALVKPKRKFTIVKTQGLALLDTVFTITGAVEEKRLVTHLDGRPAATVYSEAIGVPEEEMDFAGAFFDWPFGLMVGDEPFLRVAVERLPDSSLRFLNSLKEGMRLKLARTADIVDTTRKSLEELRGRLGTISAMLHINCMSRHYDLMKAGEDAEFGALFAGYPNTGFASQGEVYIAIANATSTMLVFA